ncbi:MAG: type II toxin-antitoxin system VapC family toxin [Propionicimonas sp.]|uniref:type II toxin-antitoxin system VapC family toxin n=1 Tax=Propionicimonas sp. TaxID=1955623 RepID=UPI002B20ACB6|nr:type II toxin-antitoxin system VapC family toxin [Propionicimonas sp.]MEA4945607.1 type II toxin-antitoxin system VapC family toxin [Propionicimonas sp.]MEA5053312.1 type II toxin-antitoxin system VapC family toxin [Propionicimonas sp.]
MRLLVDAHVFLWMLLAPAELGTHARRAITKAESASLSTVSLWELTLKFCKGRLPHSPSELTAGAAALHLDELAIEHRHLVALPSVALPQADSFDRLLAAQATTDGLQLMTADRLLLASDVPTIDARR